jgi:hypothetical protein
LSHHGVGLSDKESDEDGHGGAQHRDAQEDSDDEKWMHVDEIWGK